MSRLDQMATGSDGADVDKASSTCAFKSLNIAT